MQPSCNWLARPASEHTAIPVVVGAPSTRVPRLLGGAAERQQSTERFLSSRQLPFLPHLHSHSPALRPPGGRPLERCDVLPSTRELRGCPASSAGRNYKPSLPLEKQSQPSCNWLARPVSEHTAIPVVAGAPSTRVPRLLGGAAERQQSTERFFLRAACDQPTPCPSRFSGDASIRSGRHSSRRGTQCKPSSPLSSFFTPSFLSSLWHANISKSIISTATGRGVAAVTCTTEASRPHPARLQQQLHFVTTTGASGKSSCRVRLSVELHSPSPSQHYEGDPKRVC